jgi:hypothetical protein
MDIFENGAPEFVWKENPFSHSLENLSRSPLDEFSDWNGRQSAHCSPLSDRNHLINPFDGAILFDQRLAGVGCNTLVNKKVTANVGP